MGRLLGHGTLPRVASDMMDIAPWACPPTRACFAGSNYVQRPPHAYMNAKPPTVTDAHGHPEVAFQTPLYNELKRNQWSTVSQP